MNQNGSGNCKLCITIDQHLQLTHSIDIFKRMSLASYRTHTRTCIEIRYDTPVLHIILRFVHDHIS